MPPAANARLYRFGIYQADLRSGELRKNGAKLKLQEQPFQVLAMLLERPGEVVTREDVPRRENRIDLTPTGLLMEGLSTQNRCQATSSARNCAKERIRSTLFALNPRRSSSTSRFSYNSLPKTSLRREFRKSYLRSMSLRR